MPRLELAKPRACAWPRAEPAPIEIEYTAVRITGNDAEVEELRKVLGFARRIGILARVTRLIHECAGGAPIRNPP